jgi:hypothetical protein
MKHDWTAGEAWGKSTASVVGGFAVFLTFGLAMGTALPRLGVSLPLALALSVVLCVPLWALVAGWAVLAPSGSGAWLRVGGLAALLAGITAAALLL